ncbi:MAG: cation:proton antiporter, partial [Emcibacteraceae bacterium]|nr:cation:proton antiporter [Emcibacteraceae bacterium]
MDYMWIAVAFVCGYLVRQIKLPPFVGYLAAGFGLHLAGVTPDDTLESLSDIGITLLLFTIGLKLDVRSLLKKEIWGTATSHMLMIVLFLTGNSLLLGSLGLMYFSDLSLTGSLLIAFALSFSSTVCAVKVLEERAELRSRHGQIAIGILIIQDIAAVVF